MLTYRDPGSNREEVRPPLIDANMEMQLRLEYAMAIIRLVNGISDSAQKKKVASSVAALASSAGKESCPISPEQSVLLLGCHPCPGRCSNLLGNGVFQNLSFQDPC